MSDYFGKEIFKLGFGLMRLPKLPSGKIDIAQTSEMVDRFIAAGGTYFDTAFVYDNGESEAAARKALVERYPRESYTLCTKLCAWMQCHDEKSAKQQFFTSLERTGAGYFDYYLLHALQRGNYKKYDEYHIWDFVKEQKEKGLIKYYGFSFHADPALLEELLTAHPDVDFIQLQMLSPLMSFVITSAMGNPMPVVARLPFMMTELAVFAVISGLFTKKISNNGLWAFPAVILAQVTGRATFLGLIALTQSFTQFTPSMIWTQIQTGFIGLLVQALLVPVIIIGLRKLMVREND